MTWTAEVVRARYVEAVETETRLPRESMRTSTGYWPTYDHTFEDKAGWGTKRLAEEREMRSRRIPPSAAAISRHTEVMEWTAERISDENDRVLVWAFARCKAEERSFSAWCKKSGMVRMTAYRRLERMLEVIAGSLRNDNILLRLPDGFEVLQPEPSEGISFGRLADFNDDAPPISPTSMILDKAVDQIETPEALAAFEKHLAAVNRDRRRDQERREAKRRKALGLEAA